MKNNKNNKKGELVGETTVKVVIALVVIVILIIAIVKAYKILNESNEQEKMKKQIEKLNFNIRDVNEKGSERIVDIILKPGWIIKTFPNNDYPEGECKKAYGCLCICEDYFCSDTKACEGFDFEVKVDEGVFVIAAGVLVETMKIEKSLENIVVFRDKETVKLRKEKIEDKN